LPVGPYDVEAMESAPVAWAVLGEPWQVAVGQAWESWVAGSAGVGAALIDAEGAVVAQGRNRMAEASDGRLSGTVMAHAEMDVLAVVSNCPQTHNLANDYHPTPIRVAVRS